MISTPIDKQLGMSVSMLVLCHAWLLCVAVVCAGTLYTILISEQGLQTESEQLRQKGKVTASSFNLANAWLDCTAGGSV